MGMKGQVLVMMKPIVVTLGALALAIAPLWAAASANAQSPKSPPACGSTEPREVSLYFELDSTELNDFSKTLVDRVANEAKNCGLSQVVAETRVDGKRAAVITDTFQARGMRVILLTPAMAPSAGDDVAGRSAKLRLTMAEKIG
jgi:hypothetical protein